MCSRPPGISISGGFLKKRENEQLTKQKISYRGQSNSKENMDDKTPDDHWRDLSFSSFDRGKLLFYLWEIKIKR